MVRRAPYGYCALANTVHSIGQRCPTGDWSKSQRDISVSDGYTRRVGPRARSGGLDPAVPGVNVMNRSLVDHVTVSGGMVPTCHRGGQGDTLPSMPSDGKALS
jgi:hypothetical protein